MTYFELNSSHEDNVLFAAWSLVWPFFGFGSSDS